LSDQERWAYKPKYIPGAARETRVRIGELFERRREAPLAKTLIFPVKSDHPRNGTGEATS